MSPTRFDEHDRLKKTVFPHPTSIGFSNLSDYEEYEYDHNGNLLGKRTREADWILNTYDALNRQVRKVVQVADDYSTIGARCANDICYKIARAKRRSRFAFQNQRTLTE